MKKLFCCPALELFCCLPLWKTVLFVSSRAFSLSTPTFSLSTPVDNSEATRKKATECNKETFLILIYFFLQLEAKDERLVTFGHELEGAKRNLLEKERQMTELQDKFMQSSVHIMEETIK